MSNYFVCHICNKRHVRLYYLHGVPNIVEKYVLCRKHTPKEYLDMEIRVPLLETLEHDGMAYSISTAPVEVWNQFYKLPDTGRGICKRLPRWRVYKA